MFSATGVGVPLALLENVIENFSVNYLQIFSNNIVMIPEIFIVAFVLTKLFKPEQPCYSYKYYCIPPLKERRNNHSNKLLDSCCCLPFINVGRKENLKGVSIDIILVVCGCMLIGTAGAAAGSRTMYFHKGITRSLPCDLKYKLQQLDQFQ